MEIQEQVLKFRYHFLGALLLCLTLFSLILMAPRFITLLAYFCPLFLSTALVLALVFVFAKTSPLPSSDATSLHSAGQGLLNYVAGHHDLPFDTRHNSD
ncbi:hypothetical protein PHAVU_008G278500 [Phaseolus vulgaris]|uniref:Uncharacterized protein n=1 Tax=Phaseolus vulgaris TaxID=3885 RepID=V7BC13_PHAVU|nr:hypothetical protein PHAVU_008G278500g [Phaseolus vulgaris]ESW14408.1 hypothetical protein PHAVU_008G278500g [Phaseolus vulgaris]